MGALPVLLRMLVLFVTTTKILAAKAGYASLACRPTCLFLCPLLLFLLKCIFCKLLCLEQSTFYRYLYNQPNVF